jgi:hypothetical protein
MTKKHFIMIGDVFKESRPEPNWCSGKKAQWEKDVLDMADLFEWENPRFNRSLWLEYVGLHLLHGKEG